LRLFSHDLIVEAIVYTFCLKLDFVEREIMTELCNQLAEEEKIQFNYQCNYPGSVLVDDGIERTRHAKESNRLYMEKSENRDMENRPGTKHPKIVIDVSAAPGNVIEAFGQHRKVFRRTAPSCI